MSPIAYPGLPASAPPAYPPARFPSQPDGALSERSSAIAGLLQIFLGWFGAGRFYTGHVAMALAQMGIVWGVMFAGFCAGVGLEIIPLPFMLTGCLWPFIDGVVLLHGGQRDRHGRFLRD
jgi:hypothetical protein